MVTKKLFRNSNDGMIGGVCAGVSDYLEIDVTLIRLLLVFAILMGFGITPYIICWILIPDKS